MSGQIQTLATPPPVSVQTLLYNIYLAAASGGSSGAAWGSITGTLSAQTDLQSALDAKLNLAGGTMTGALVNSTNGAASASSFRLTGTVFTGGTSTTTKPLALVEPTGTTSTGWSTNGTGVGVNLPTGFTGEGLDIQINGSSKLRANPAQGFKAIGLASNSGFLCRDAGDTTSITQLDGSGGLLMSQNHMIGWNNAFSAGNGRLMLSAQVSVSNVLTLGSWVGSATPAAVRIAGQFGSGANVAGGDLNLGTQGTGTGTGGRINLQTHAAGSSGSTLGTLVNVLSIISPGVIRITGIPTSSAGLSSGDVYSNAGILTIVS